MLRKKQQASYQQNYFSIIPYTFILKMLPILFSIFLFTGCYTILTPPAEYIQLDGNKPVNDDIDTLIVENVNVHVDCYSSYGHAGHCCSIHARYNTWTGSYYCDPYYYNYSYYNHHYNNNYWWHSSHDWRYNDYSHNHSYVSSNSYVPSKKTRRDRSFSRISDDSVVDNVNQNDTASSSVQINGNSSHTENIQTDNSYSENTENSDTSTDSQTIKTNTKPRRKHNRKPL